MAQKRFRRHQDQRLAVSAVQLTAQDVEIVGRGRAVRHDPVVATTHLQETLQTGRAVLRTLPFKAVRQKDGQTRHTQPFRFTRRDELVEHDLRAVGEVAKLGFPHHQRVGFGQRIAILETQHRVFRQHRIDDLVMGLTLADVVQRIVTLFVFLVDQSRVALRERATRTVLTGQTDRETFG